MIKTLLIDDYKVVLWREGHTTVCHVLYEPDPYVCFSASLDYLVAHDHLIGEFMNHRVGQSTIAEIEIWAYKHGY